MPTSNWVEKLISKLIVMCLEALRVSCLWPMLWSSNKLWSDSGTYLNCIGRRKCRNVCHMFLCLVWHPCLDQSLRGMTSGCLTEPASCQTSFKAHWKWSYPRLWSYWETTQDSSEVVVGHRRGSHICQCIILKTMPLLGMVAHAHEPSYSGGWERRVTWVQQFKTSPGKLVRLRCFVLSL